MLIDKLKQIAKETLVKFGNHQPMFMLCSDEKIIGRPMRVSIFNKLYTNLNAEELKTKSVFWMGVIAREFGANRLIMIWDAAMMAYPPDTKKEDIGITDLPLQFPRSMRTECLTFNDISFVTGEGVTSAIPYKGGEGVPVEFLENIIPEGTYIDSRFTELALEGYNKST